MQAESIVLVEISKGQKENPAWSHLFVEPKQVDLKTAESVIVAVRGCDE